MSGLRQAGLSYGEAVITPGARAIQLTVANGAVEVQLGHGVGGIRWDHDASFRIPGVHVIPGPADAIRVRSAVAHSGVGRDLWPQYAVAAS